MEEHPSSEEPNLHYFIFVLNLFPAQGSCSLIFLQLFTQGAFHTFFPSLQHDCGWQHRQPYLFLVDVSLLLPLDEHVWI